MNTTKGTEPEKDEQYDSEEDEDFNPTDGPGGSDARDDDLSESSDDEEEDTSESAPKPKKTDKKRKQGQADAEIELDSGDEATIRELKQQRKKRRKTDKGLDKELDSGGEGGLIKTRAQRRAEKQEKAEFRAADRGQVTVDVDSLWAQLSSVPIGRQKLEPPAPPHVPANTDSTQANNELTQSHAGDTGNKDDEDDEMITIKRSYGYAGQTVTEKKRVLKSSAEAKLYLSTHDPSKAQGAKSPSPDSAHDQEHSQQLRRPLRRASRFEPNPTGEAKGLPLERQRLRTPSRTDVLAQQERREDEDRRKGKVQKLTTVQKSAIDWAAHVDREGLKEELDVYGRSKSGFLGRMEFMRGVKGRKENEERTARLATSAAAATANS